MPRPLRVHPTEGALCYVTLCAEEGTAIFQDQTDLEAYLSLLSEYKQTYGFQLFAYALAPDRIHLCLEVGQDSTVSQIMHALNSRYSKIHRSRRHRTGPLFKDRFRLTVAEKELYLVPITRYLHTRADLIAGSLSHYLTDDSSLVDTAQVLAYFQQEEDPRRAYEAFIRQVTPEQLEQLGRELAKPLVGSPRFVEQLQQQVQQRREEKPETVDAPAPMPRGWHMDRFISMAAILGLLFSVTQVVTLSNRAMTLANRQARVMVTPAVAMQPVVSQVPMATMAVLTPLSIQGTSWDIQIGWMDSSGKVTVQSDRLQFDGKQVVSEWLKAQGFSGSNYTLTYQNGGTSIWETMQTDSKGETVCWRGEWDGHMMRGIGTRQAPGKASVNFTFRGLSRPQGGAPKMSEI